MGIWRRLRRKKWSKYTEYVGEEGDGVWRGMDGEYGGGSGKSRGRRGNLEAEVQEVEGMIKVEVDEGEGIWRRRCRKWRE